MYAEELKIKSTIYRMEDEMLRSKNFQKQLRIRENITNLRKELSKKNVFNKNV